jgi:chemotaxis protein CheD
MTVIVNISDAKASADPSDTLATYSLGSCIGVTLYDPVRRVGGLLHYQLPTSTIDPGRAVLQPAMFADTGIAEVLRQMQALGADPKRLRVTLAGAGQMLNDARLFNIGKRNELAARELLGRLGLHIERADVGGTLPRNVYLNVADGVTTVKVCGKVEVA